jgi:hypothetical protein
MNIFGKFTALLAMSTVPIISLAAGNPNPGSPHDTLIFHLKKDASGVVNCNGGGHAAFIRYDYDSEMPYDTDIFITMVDWVQVDNDGDGLFDEDPEGDANDDGYDDDDFDGETDEDGVEPGASTGFIDCDGLDGDITLQIRDTEPGKGVISTQDWHIRAIGKPEQTFAFDTKADQVTCEYFDPDTIPDSGDEYVDCSYGEEGDWIQLGSVDLSSYDGSSCVKQVKLGAKNSRKGGGKTAFCDITPEFEVDVDLDGSGFIDDVTEEDQFIFSVSCEDVPETVDVDESQTCDLARMIWEIDASTTSKAKAQVFVSHTGKTNIKGGKIKGPGSK